MRPAPIPAKHEVDVFVGPCLAFIGWFWRLVALMGAPRRSKRLKRFAARAERYVAFIVFLWAAARVPPPPPRPRHPYNIPPGFRRGRRNFRRFLRHARIAARGAGFAQRMDRLVSVLADPEPYVARYAAVLARGVKPGALIVAAPPAWDWADAPAPAVAFADSS
jgi:hypothetical protein